MTIAGLLLVAVLVIRLFPATPAGKWLHLHLVELPIAFAATVERRHILFLVLLILFAQAATALPMMESGAIMLWDLATYVDAAAVAYAAAVLSRSRWVVGALRARLSRPRRRSAPRARRSAPKRRELPANDDGEDGRGGLRLAA